jgi:hypothetical protein
MIRAARTVLALTLVGGALVACTPDEAPPVGQPTSSAPVASPTPPVTPSAMPSPSGSAVVDVTVAPERPDALDAKPSEDGAVKVGEYFVSLYPYVAATGDFKAWKQLSNEECVFCESARSGLQDLFSAGGHTVGGAIAIDRSSGRTIKPGASYTVRVDFIEDASRTVDASGAEIESSPGPNELTATLVVHWDGSWNIRAAQFDPQT